MKMKNKSIHTYKNLVFLFLPSFSQPQLHSYATKLAVAIVLLLLLATQLADTGLVGLPLRFRSPPISFILSTWSRFQAVVRGTFGGGGTSGPCRSSSHC